MMENNFPESRSLGHRLKKTPIAIVGMGGIMPGARNIAEFWSGLVSSNNGTSPVPPKGSYWEPNLFVKDRSSESPLGIPHSIAGYLPEVRFDPMNYGITPHGLSAISSFQLYALLVAEETLRDAGLGRKPEWDQIRRNTGVILATSGLGSHGYEASKQLDAEYGRCILRDAGLSSQQTEEILSRIQSIYPGWQENTFPGLLPNICAGRIANRFDLKGPNYTVDAACAASLAAMRAAVLELMNGEADAVLTGAVNVDNSVLAFLCYEEVKALSRRGQCRPFDVEADGMILGDAVGMLLLKRLPDAERDGDKIYALIRGIGAASDGLAKSIYAPHWQGQVDAMERAYRGTDLAPADITVMEMHGTGTPVGDPVEIHSLKTLYSPYQMAPRTVAIGSVKAQVGHTRLAAGLVSTIKMALALHHKQIPATINVSRVNPRLGLAGSPFYVNTSLRPWVATPGQSRKAGINAFGFGGTNFHLLMEEYTGAQRPKLPAAHPQIAVFAASNTEVLIKKLEEAQQQLRQQNYLELLLMLTIDRGENRSEMATRLSIVTKSWDELHHKIKLSLESLRDQRRPLCCPEDGIYFFDGSKHRNIAKLALFPGQGVQDRQLGRELICSFPQYIDLLGEWDALAWKWGLERVSNLLYPIAGEAQGAEAQLPEPDIHSASHAQLVLGFLNHVLMKFLAAADFQADYALGHSFGELSALYAAGILDDATYMEATMARAKAMEEAPSSRHYSLLAVPLSAQAVKALLADRIDGEELAISCINSEKQTVVGGPLDELEQFKAELLQQNIQSVLLKAGHAFHTRHMAKVKDKFAEAIRTTVFHEPGRCHVLSCATGEIHAQEGARIKRLLVEQMVSPVQFLRAVQTVRQREASILCLEIGPKQSLSQLLKAIVGPDSPAIEYAASCPLPQKSWTEQLAHFLAELCARGMAHPGDFSIQLDASKPSVESPVTVTIDGGVRYGADIDLRRRAWFSDRPVSAAQKTFKADSSPGPKEGSASETLAQSLCQLQHEFLNLHHKIQDQLTSEPTFDSAARKLAQTRDQLTDVQMKFLEQLPHFMDQVDGQASTRPSASLQPREPIESLLEMETLSKTNSVPSPVQDAEMIRNVMIKVVHEKTGYPRDLIKMDQDIERDLGIDSIKRLDILSEMAEQCPDFSLETLQESQITQLRTLGEIHAFIVSLLDPSQGLVSRAEPSIAVTRSGATARAESLDSAMEPAVLPSYQLKLTTAPVLMLEESSASNQALLIVASTSDSNWEQLADRMSDCGYDSALLFLSDQSEAQPKTPAKYPSFVFQADDSQDLFAAPWFQDLAAKRSELSLIFMATSGGTTAGRYADGPLLSMAEALFFLCQKFLKKGAPKLRRFVSISWSDGCLGITGSSDGSPMGLGAFAKSLAREYPSFPIRHVDINQELSSAEKLLVLQQELTVNGYEGRESGRPDPESRSELSLELPSKRSQAVGLPWKADDIILVTGGGRGITADCILALSKSLRARYVILGRTELQDEPAWACGVMGEAELKQKIAEHLSAEQPGFVAKAVKQRYQDICRGRALRSQLSTLKSMGLDVHYFALDIADRKRVQSTVAHIESQIGPIAALVHGAGMTLDRKLHLKSFSDFDQVLRTKMSGIFNLLDAMNMAALQRVVLFSSISAIVGNMGQTDYAMANGILNGLSCQLNATWPHLKSSAIAFGPWNGGLVDGTLRQFFAKKGIPLIEPQEGTAAFVEVFLHPDEYGALTLIAKNPKAFHEATWDAPGMGMGL